MSTLRRTAIAGIGLAASLVLAGCAGSSGGENGSGDTEAQKASKSSVPQASGGPEIASPKNAAAVDVCNLLPSDAAAKIGVKPQGEKQTNSLNAETSPSCAWTSPDGRQFVSLAAFDGRSIQTYYKNKDSYVDFQKLTIAGYPAVRANKVDPKSSGSCALFLATKNNQVVGANVQTPDAGQVDPCGVGKKMLKLSLPTWPAAK